MKAFLEIILKFSCIIYPQKLSNLFERIENLTRSVRFSTFVKKSGANLSLRGKYYSKGLKYVSVGDNFTAFSGFRIECWDEYHKMKYTPEITIGNNVCFNFWCHIGAINKIEIKDNVLIGSNVLITDHDHGKFDEKNLQLPPNRRGLYSKGPVIINENVWIGENVAILSGVEVGIGCIIASNSVVTHSIPAYCLVAGVPAKIIKKLY